MTGFIRGFFGSKPKIDDQPLDEQIQAAQDAKEQEKAYFLSPDDAKTFGNIDYMRTAKTIKRTFPKTAGGQSSARIEQVSALESVRMQSNGTGSTPDYMQKTPSQNGAQPDYMSTVQSAEPTFDRSATEERRRTDTNMDMFRNMARDLKR